MKMPRRNPSPGSILLQAIDSGALQQIHVRNSTVRHFEVDKGAHLFVLTAREDGADRWRATLDVETIAALKKASEQDPHSQPSLFAGPYLWIACGEECCEMRPHEWKQVLDVASPSETTIHLRRPPNCSFRVWSKVGRVSRTIPLRRFPSLAV